MAASKVIGRAMVAVLWVLGVDLFMAGRFLEMHARPWKRGLFVNSCGRMVAIWENVCW